MTKDNLWPLSNVYALHGVDFMLDDNMKLWFIESNPTPQFGGSTKSKNKIYRDLLWSAFEVEYMYYQSRMKRVLGLINRITSETDEGKAVNYQKWRTEYKEATKNRLEPEYQLSSNNTFQIVMDENIKGPGAYFGNIDEGCINF